MLRVLTSLLVVAFATPAMAGEFSYNYIEAGYQRVELDDNVGFTVDGDLYGIGGSVEIGNSFRVFGDYASTDLQFDVDIDQYSLGIGYHTPVSANLDVIFDLAYVHAEADAIGLSVDEDGYGASVGVRSMLGNRFELTGSVNYVDLGSGSDDTSLATAFRYYVTPAVSFGVNVGVGDDLTSYGAAIQVYFGK